MCILIFSGKGAFWGLSLWKIKPGFFFFFADGNKYIRDMGYIPDIREVQVMGLTPVNKFDYPRPHHKIVPKIYYNKFRKIFLENKQWKFDQNFLVVVIMSMNSFTNCLPHET